MANLWAKGDQRITFCVGGSDDDGLRQLRVDVITGVLDGNDAAAFQMGDDSDGLTAVTAKRKQKRVQLFVIGFDPLNDVLLANLCSAQIHNSSPIKNF